MPGARSGAQGRRRPVASAAPAGPATGDPGVFRAGEVVEVTIEDVAQGGWCVARPAGRPVMFVRHALPGERVMARVTEVTSRFARADAVEIRTPSADRVPPPCPSAHPGGCGGCDWQHASLAAQRALKAAVVAEQLRRLARIDLEVTVEPLPGDEPAERETAAREPAADTPGAPSADADGHSRDTAHSRDTLGPSEGTKYPASSPTTPPNEITATSGTPGLGWRTRVQFAVRADGVAGLRAHRSHEVVDIGDCLIAHPAIRALDIPADDWTGAVAVEAAVGSAMFDNADPAQNAAVIVVEEDYPDGRDRGRGHGRGDSRGRGANRRQQGRPRTRRTLAEGRQYLTQYAAGRYWQVSAGSFWQVHPAAADTLSAALLAALEPKPGDTVLDLYCGAGLFAGVIAPLVGADGAVLGIESDAAAVKDARQNLSDYPWVTVCRADVAQAVRDADLPQARLVVADPPRTGLAAEIVGYLTGDSPAARFGYVSCDPATLARDIALLAKGGWSLAGLRAFDAFPMTHHVECVAVLTR
jgi:tRNA/tmRNA/rRNA uracil-C5-methylase (TrmA/RlmC/RlmD family)